MSEEKNKFSFDDELISNLEKLKIKYSAFDEYEMDLQNNTDFEEEKPADFKYNARRKAKKTKPAQANYKFDSENPAEMPAELNYDYSELTEKETPAPEGSTSYAFSDDKKENPDKSRYRFGFSDNFSYTNENNKAEKEAYSSPSYEIKYTPAHAEPAEEEAGTDAYGFEDTATPEQEDDEPEPEDSGEDIASADDYDYQDYSASEDFGGKDYYDEAEDFPADGFDGEDYAEQEDAGGEAFFDEDGEAPADDYDYQDYSENEDFGDEYYDESEDADDGYYDDSEYPDYDAADDDEISDSKPDDGYDDQYYSDYEDISSGSEQDPDEVYAAQPQADYSEPFSTQGNYQPPVYNDVYVAQPQNNSGEQYYDGTQPGDQTSNEDCYHEIPEDPDDDFSDLDDDNDLVVIGSKKDAGNKGAHAQGKPAPAAQQAPAPKKVKNQKKPSSKKGPGKKAVVILCIAIPVVLWLMMFLTDLVLVNKWYSPFFCIETAEYENGGKDYVGLFYKVQFKMDKDGESTGEIVPWFVDGPNDKPAAD